MKNRLLFFPVLITVVLSSACNTTSVKNDIVDLSEPNETLYVYEDGQMKLNSRYINSQDVVIYPDGQGGEKAAVKVRVPIHSDFYRDSIIVVRVENKFEEAVTQNEPENVDNVN